jgi:RHS repeat-associated protein
LVREYDSAGNLLAETDSLGAQTTYEYDDSGRLTKVTAPDPDGTGPQVSPITQYAYDKAGNLRFVTDPLGNGTEYVYDARNRRIQVIQPDPDGAGAAEPPVTEYEYDDGGQLLSVTDPLGRVTSYQYDALGRTVSETNELNKTRYFRYDAVGNLTERIDRLGRSIVTQHDNLYRQTAELWYSASLPVADVDTTTDGTGTNEVQRVGFSVDYMLMGGTFTLTFDGQTTSAINDDASAATVLSALEALSNIGTGDVAVSKVVDTSLAREWRITFQGSLVGRSNVAQVTVDSSSISGYMTVTDVEETDTAGSATNEVQVITLTDATGGTFTLSFDGQTTTTLPYNATAGTVECALDVLSSIHTVSVNRTGLSATIGATADFANSYVYDGLGRMTRVEQLGQSGGNGVAAKRVDLSYNALGQFTEIVRQTKPSSTWNEVVTSTYGYDSLHRLTSLDHTHGATDINDYTWTFDNLSGAVPGLSELVGGGNSIVQALSLGALFGGLGRITQMTSADGTSNYSYDTTSQLTGADHDYQSDEIYTYDANGNRTMAGYDTGDNNQLLEDGTYAYEYDDEGNRTLRTNLTTDESTEYVWEYRNRLIQVTDKDDLGATTQVVTYAYDVFNRRIARAVDTSSPFDMADAFIEHYILDDASGIASLDGGNVILDFVDPDGPEGTASIELAKRYLYGPAVDQILAQEDLSVSLSADSRVLWPLGDHLQTTRDLVDQTGAVEEHFEYDSYGNVTSGDITLTRYLFTAREFDEATGLQYNRARWYDAGVGKWVSEDPIAFIAEDVNLQRYVGIGPLNALDPDGQQERKPPRGIPDNNYQGLGEWKFTSERDIYEFLVNLLNPDGNNFPDNWFDVAKRGCIGLNMNRIGWGDTGRPPISHFGPGRFTMQGTDFFVSEGEARKHVKELSSKNKDKEFILFAIQVPLK